MSANTGGRAGLFQLPHYYFVMRFLVRRRNFSRLIRIYEAPIPVTAEIPSGDWGGQVSNGELATTLERVAEGDRVAFRNLYRDVGPRLFSICKRLMRDHDAAQDALQDVMVRIWEKSPLFDRAKGDAMGWMLALARNVVFNRLSEKSAMALSLSDDEVASVVDRLSVGSDPSLGSDLRRCLGGLKEEYRRCVVMAYHYGLSYEELSALSAVPLGTVKTWIHRAIGQLQTCLSQ